MKKIVKLLTLVAVVCVMTVSAFADVMWEPMMNTFYDSHRTELEYINRNFEALKDTKACNEPEGVAELSVDAGTKLNIGYVWYDGNGHAYGITTDENELWVNMADFKILYDCQAFRDTHADEIVERKVIKPFENVTELAVYSYPLSGSSFTVDHGISELSFAEIYTDENGREWGYISYHYGLREVWACLDAPEGVDEKVEYTLPDDYTGLSDEFDPNAEPTNNSMPVKLIIVIAVVAAIALTAYLLIVRKFKKEAQS